MEKEYIFGYLPSEADKMTLDEIYTYLIDKGVIDNTVSKNDLAIVLEGVIKSITPDMIRGNVTIAGVTGNVATKVEEIYVDKFDEVEIPEKTIEQEIDYSYFGYDNCTYKYTAPNGIDAYGVYMANSYPGVYYKNLETGETYKIENTAYCCNKSMTIGDTIYLYPEKYYDSIIVCKGNTAVRLQCPEASSNFPIDILNLGALGVYVYVKYKNGVYKLDDNPTTLNKVINGQFYNYYKTKIDGTYYMFTSLGVYEVHEAGLSLVASNKFYELSVFESSSGDIYFSSSSTGSSNSYGILYKPRSSNSFTNIYNERGWNLFYEDQNGNIYIRSSNSQCLGVLCKPIDVSSATKIYSTKYAWSYCAEQNGIIYMWNTSGNGILMCTTTTAELINDTFRGNAAFYDKYGTIYITSYSSTTPGILCIVNGEISTICPSIYTSSSVSSMFTNDPNNGLYIINSSQLPGLHYLENGVVHTIVDSGKFYLKYNVDNKLYISGTTGIVYLNGTESLIISTNSWNTSYAQYTKLYTDSNGHTYLSSTSSSMKGVFLLNGEHSIELSSTMSGCIYFESSTHTVYAITSSSILIIKNGAVTNTVTPVSSIYTSNISNEHPFFECPSGTIMWASTDMRTVYFITETTAGTCYNKGIPITHTIGDITYYIPSSSSYITYYGIPYIMNGINTLDCIILSEKASNVSVALDKVYTLHTDGNGIGVVNGTVYTKVYGEGDNWQYIGTDNTMDSYFVSSNSSYNYMLMISPIGETSIVYNNIYGKFSYFITKDDIIIICSARATSGSSAGLFMIKDGVVTRLYAGVNGNISYYEVSNGDVYVTGVYSDYIYCLRYEDKKCARITVKNSYITSSYYLEHFTYLQEVSEGIYYLSAYTSSYNYAYPGFYIIKDYKIHSFTYEGYAYTKVITYNNNTYLASQYQSTSSKASGYQDIRYVNGVDNTKIVNGYAWNLIEFNNTHYFQNASKTYIIEKDKIVKEYQTLIPFEYPYIKFNDDIYIFIKDSVVGSGSTATTVYTSYYINFNTGKTFSFSGDIREYYYYNILRDNSIVLLQYENSMFTGEGLYIIYNDTIYTSTENYMRGDTNE